MKTNLSARISFPAILGIVSLCSPALAQYYAQDESRPGYDSPSMMGASQQVGEEVPEEEPEGDENPFDTFTVVPALGYAYYMPASITAAGQSFEVQARNSFLAQFHIDFGGDGAAFEMIPFIAAEAGGSGFSALDFSTAEAGNALGGTYFAVGGRGHLVYRFRIGRFYPHIGIGAHVAYLMGNEITYGAEVYGRVPFGVTIYLTDFLGLVVEGGVMYGVMGIQQDFTEEQILEASLPEGIDPTALTDEEIAALQDQAQADAMEELTNQFHTGRGWGFDFSIGVRFP